MEGKMNAKISKDEEKVFLQKAKIQVLPGYQARYKDLLPKQPDVLSKNDDEIVWSCSSSIS